MSEVFQKEIRGLLGRLPLLGEIHAVERTGSTQEDAVAAGRRGAAHGSLWIAESQSAGKGRLGRSWESKPGMGLYFSLLLKPAMKASAAPLTSLAAGIGLAEALRGLGIQNLGVKWPNDLLVGGRKLAGILAEMVNRGEEVDFLVLGVGLNVAQQKTDFSPELQGHATSLAELTGGAWDRADLLAELLPRLFASVENLARGGAEGLCRDWEKKSGMVGKAVAYAGMDGSSRQGRVLGLNPEGHLRVEHADGTVAELIAEETTLL